MSDSGKPNPGTTLLIGFDSAWTRENRGAIVGVVRNGKGAYQELGWPQIANFTEAATVIRNWRTNVCPAATTVMLDQPTIVTNAAGQCPVENLVSSPVSRRYGGMQPANTSKAEMFGPEAPVWQFLDQFGGAVDTLSPSGATQVFETYPVLAMIALGWLLPDQRIAGRLPKYNPERRATFSVNDWRYVCEKLIAKYAGRQLSGLDAWLCKLKAKDRPRKADQDCLDACICLLVCLYLAEQKSCLMVGNIDMGYIVVPHGNDLQRELEERCINTQREPAVWVRTVTQR